MFENYDATTGLKIEEQTVDSFSQSAIKEAEQKDKEQKEKE